MPNPSMTGLPPLVYEPVSEREIRLLTPDASISKNGLSWSLKKANIDDPSLHFTALSYTWETQSHPNTFPISCNKCQLQVHYNLYTALPFLARRFEADLSTATAYWIDAICINQTDDEEKLSQIRLMNTVYRRADKVLIWLGLPSEPEWHEAIPRAIQLLPLLMKEWERSSQTGINIPQDFEVDREITQLGRAEWETILHLVRNNYFRRLWIVQEITLAQDIMFICGEHEIDSQLMEAAVADSWIIGLWAKYDQDHPEQMRIPVEGYVGSVVFLIRSIVNYNGCEGNAHQTIRIANLLAGQSCYAPQDRVLGILGMVEEDLGTACEDLHTYASVVDLYTRFSTLIFEASGLTRLHWWYYLSMAFNKKRMSGLPSWVPDLHSNDAEARRKPHESMLAANAYNEPSWQASSRPRKAAHGPRPGEIIMRGKLIDKVKLVHPEVPYFDDSVPADEAEPMWTRTITALIQWERKLADTVLYSAASPSGISEDTYWRTLIGGSCADGMFRMQFTREIWLAFRKAGQQFLEIVERLHELERYAI